MVVVLAGLLLAAPCASAATLTVTTTSDELASGDSQCSLREAIAAVNTPGSIGDCAMADGVSNVIVLGPRQYDVMIPSAGLDDQTTGDLDVNASAPPLTIEGAGVNATTISGRALNDRIMHVLPGATVTIKDLTATGGHAPSGTNGSDAVNPSTAPTKGGDGSPGGGLRNGGNLTLQNVAVSNNTAGSGGKGGGGLTDAQGAAAGNGGTGGGVENSGTLMLTNVTVSDNFAGAGGTGGAGGAGGAAGRGNTGGCCGDGGGLENDGGTVTITGSTFSANHAGAGGAGGKGGDGLGAGTAGAGGTGAGGSSGGAIATNGGSITTNNSTLSGNVSGAGGAGGNGGPNDEFNSPVPTGGNSGNGSAGGGVYAHAGAAVTLTNVTIDRNRVGGPGTPGTAGDGAASPGTTGNPAFGGGVYAPAPPAITLRNTLLDSNELGNCAGQITDSGHNLSFGFSQCPAAFLTGDPKLGSPQDNGGPTQTVALGSGSAAIGQVPAAGAGCPATDQRGLSRPSGPACDIGAYELTPPAVTAQPAASITGAGATLNGAVTANASGAQVHFEFGTSTAYGATTPTQSVGSALTPQAVTATINGLNANTTYHYRLDAISPDGMTNGPDRTFTTSTSTSTSKSPSGPPVPKLTKLKLAPAKTTKKRLGRVTISYTDSQAGKTSFVLFRPSAGVKRGKRCVAKSKSNRGRRCTRLIRVGTFTHVDTKGHNQFRWHKRIAANRLAPAAYLLQVTPRGGKPVTVKLTITG